MYNFLILRRAQFFLLLSLLILIFAPHAPAQDTEPKSSPSPVATKTGKLPVIIIPGLIGSELVNKNTGEDVWFHLQRVKGDDLRLPITPNIARNRDNLVPRDILRNVKLVRFLPEIQIYDRLIASLKADGYTEAKWDAPAATDVFYVFPYDWRRDNAETARILTQKIQALKSRLRKPDLKFNVIAHSMGGLIARYATLYGGADLPAGTRKPVPNWAGARHFNKIFLVGTPNEGSLPSLHALLNGFSFFGSGINLPFVQDLTKFDVFTIPAIYQLMPQSGTVRAFDENLKPIEIDIYDAATWEKYGWAAYTDEDFPKKNFSAAEQRNARAYLRAVLARAKRFHEALRATSLTKSPVPVFFLGAECKPTLDGMVIYRDKKDRWRTIFKPDSFERADGTKVSEKELEPLLFSPGDGTVTKRSFLTAAIRNISNNEQTSFPVCEEHRNLTGNPEIQKTLFAVLDEK